MKRRPEFTTEQFREYWNGHQFTSLIERIAAQKNGATLYAKKHGSNESFDGVLEYRWDDTSHLNTLTESQQGRALADEMLDYQRQFVHITDSTAFFVEG